MIYQTGSHLTTNKFSSHDFCRVFKSVLGYFSPLRVKICLYDTKLSFQDQKRPKTELLDAEDLAFLMDSGPPSPVPSENGAENNGGSNDSSNEALVVDCDRSGSVTPGK